MDAFQETLAVSTDGPVPALDEYEHGFTSLMTTMGVTDQGADVS